MSHPSRPGLLCATALMVALSACAAHKSRLKVGDKGTEGEVVEAEGLAPYNPKDMIATKRAALVDAQRNAVEKAVGVYVSARTMVEKAVAIENNILAKTDGYVKKYDILQEGPKDDLYYMRIRALVALKKLEQDLQQISLSTTPDLKKPHVIVDIKEEIDKESIDDQPASEALSRALSEAGFVVVGPDQAKDADLIIRGKASAYPFQGKGLGGFLSYRARLSIEAVRAGTKDVASSVSQEASGLGGNADLAGMKALETVGEMVGRDLSMSLAASWTKNKRVIVFVEGVKSFADVERVRKHLQSQPGVNDIMMRLYDEHMAQFELELGSTDAAALGAALEAGTTLPLKVLEAQGQSLRLQLP
jgi:hypothetical protein